MNVQWKILNLILNLLYNKMKKLTFHNPTRVSLQTIEQRLKMEFKNVLFQYSNSPIPLIDNEDNIIASVGLEIIATINENQSEINEIENFITGLLLPKYDRVLLEFAEKFKAIDGATVVITEPSIVSIYINNNPAAGLRLWLNSTKQPHEIEIVPFPSEEGTLLSKWVIDNQRDILKTNIYVAGDLVRMVTIV